MRHTGRMHPALLYLPGVRLSQPELSAARLDGHVVEVGDAYVPADLVEGPDVRAGAVAHLVREGTAASGPTAAWIHGAGDTAPAVHHVRRCTERRLRPHSNGRLVFHDTRVDASEVVPVGGVPVTTPVRTMVDLATSLHRDPRMLTWMAALALACPGVIQDAIRFLRGRRRVPGSRVAIAALERLEFRRR